jgi:hypothetical protein
MRAARTIFILLFSMSLVLPGAARAQQPGVVDRATIDAAVAAHAQRADDDRQTIRRVLERQEVRDVAGRIGVDLGLAQAAVGMLDGAELQRMADQARAVDSALAGGQSVTISTTALIIILLLVILLIVAID